MADVTLKQIMAFFGMDAKAMTKEWKSVPLHPTPEQKRTMLSDKDKEDIKNGIGDGTLTY
jgi:hypothetical protein